MSPCVCVRVGSINPGLQDALPERGAMSHRGKILALVVGRRGYGFSSAMACCVTLGKSLNFSGAWVPKG